MLKHSRIPKCARVGCARLTATENGGKHSGGWKLTISLMFGCCTALVASCSAQTPEPREASDVPAGPSVDAEPLLERNYPTTPETPREEAPVRATLVSAHVELEPEPELTYLSPPRVAAAVRAHQSDFLACQALANLETRHAPGAVTVGWLVEADGGVTAVQLGASSFGSTRVNQCVLNVARSMSFPASLIRTHVSWTVRFQGGADEPIAEVTQP